MAGPRLSLEPNPFDPERERLCLTLRAEGRQLLWRLFDAAGRELQVLESHLGAGSARLFWDGKDGFGRPLDDGFYPFVLRWEAPGGVWQERGGVCALRRRRAEF